jgi:hypothetical protein
MLGYQHIGTGIQNSLRRTTKLIVPYQNKRIWRSWLSVVLYLNVATFSNRCAFTFFLDVILINNDVLNFLMKVVEGCKKLESLHIACRFQNCGTFFKDLSKCIPLATNIRDLRIEAADISESVLKDLFSSIGSCSTLQRLMIYHNRIDHHDESLIFLPDCLEDLVHRLPQLVASCFIYPMDYVTLYNIRHLLSSLNWNSKNNGYVAPRPCFWHHVDNHDLPENLSFPRICIKEFVHPFPYIDSFPVFK